MLPTFFFVILVSVVVRMPFYPSFPFSVVHVPFSFPAVPAGRVEMRAILTLTHLLNRYGKDVADRVAMFRSH